MRLPSDYLSDAIGVLGRGVGKRPVWFIVSTTAVSLLLTIGMLNAKREIDLDKLFFDPESMTGRALRFHDEHFPVNYTAFQPDRVPFVPATADIIFTPKFTAGIAGNMLNEAALREILRVETRVRSLTFQFLGTTFGYEDVCARWQGSCYETATTKLLRMIDRVKIPGGDTDLDWPLFVTEHDGGGGFQEIFLPTGLGSVVRDDREVVRSVGAVKSTFYLRLDGELNTELSRAWQAEFVRYMDSLNGSSLDNDNDGVESVQRLRHTNVVYNEDQRIHNIVSALPARVIRERAVVSVAALTFFSVVAFMTADWVTSKPALGFVAVVSCGLATGATYGLLLAAGYRLSGLLGAVPFLALGVGIDDAFVLGAVYRLTDRKLSVPGRMEAAYREAAVSITITSLTDVIAFATGSFMPLRGFSDFCLFAALSMAMTYIYALLFFGGFLALTGKAEEEGRHCLTFRIMSKGGMNASGSTDIKKGPSLMERAMKVLEALRDVCPKVRSIYVEALHHWLTKTFVCVTFVAYLAGAVYGMTKLKVVVDWRSLAPSDDMYIHYASSLEAHFLEFPPPIQVMIGGDVDYSNKTTQDRIEHMFRALENSKYFRDSLYTQSWLRGVLAFIENRASLDELPPADVSTETAFVQYLQDVYLKGKPSVDSLDVQIEDGKIKASRFLILPQKLEDANKFPQLVVFLRNFFKGNFTDMVVHHTNAMYIRVAEPGLRLLQNTFSSLTYAIICVCIITLLLATRIICSLFICGTVCTVMAGLLGYFQLCGQDYSSAMMMAMLMSIGFSVDYSAHFAFTYTGRPIQNCSSREKLSHTSQAVGVPILLGALTSFIGLCGLMNAPSEAYNLLFRVGCSMILLSLYHGLIVLPILLLVADDVYNFLKSCCGRVFVGADPASSPDSAPGSGKWTHRNGRAEDPVSANGVLASIGHPKIMNNLSGSVSASNNGAAPVTTGGGGGGGFIPSEGVRNLAFDSGSADSPRTDRF